MNECIKAVHFDRKNGKDLFPVHRFGPENAKKVNDFHRSFPEYTITPLVNLAELAKSLGVARIYVYCLSQNRMGWRISKYLALKGGLKFFEIMII